LFENNFSKFISRNSLFSTLYFNQFANQFDWNFNRTFDNKKRELQEVLNKILSDFLLLKLRDENEYIEWNTNTKI